VRTLLAIALLVAFVSGPTSAQRNIDPATVDIKTQKLDENVYMLQFLGPAGAAGNVGGNVGAFVGADGIVIVDSGFAPLAPKLEAALKAISDKPVRYVLNTHWHGDHSGADGYFGARAIIVAHESARRKMLQGGMLFPPSPAVALPAVTFADRITVHMAGRRCRGRAFRPWAHRYRHHLLFPRRQGSSDWR
jgi:cyclase